MPSQFSSPGRRIAYDQDGTRGFVVNAERKTPELKGTLQQVHPDALKGLNGDKAGGMIIEGRRYVGGTPYVVTPGIWDYASYDGMRNYLVLFFAEPMRLRGWYAQLVMTWQETHETNQARDSRTVYPGYALEVSVDTTNGLDGTWKEVAYQDPDQLVVQTTQQRDVTSQRDAITGVWVEDTTYYSGVRGVPIQNPEREEFIDGRTTGKGWMPLYGGYVRNVKAVRISAPSTGSYGSLYRAMALLHLYGEPDVNAGETRLALVDPVTEDELLLDPSWGDVDYRVGGQISFAVKNLSTTQTAEGVLVGITGAYPDGELRIVYQHDPDTSDPPIPYFLNPLDPYLELSTDEVTWTPSLDLGDLAPEETVTVFARLLPPVGEVLPPPLYIEYTYGFLDPVPVYVDPGYVGFRHARIDVTTEGWV